jgi:hypothetical protein
MATQFFALHFKNLPIDPHFGYFSRWFVPELTNYPAVSAIVADLRPEFNEWYEKEKTLLDWVRRSEYTVKIAEANKALDQALSAFWAQVRSASFLSSTEQRDAAARLELVHRRYGYIQKKPYETEASDVLEILGMLEIGGERAADVAILELNTWVLPIRVAYTAFNNLFHNRNAEWMNRPNYTFRDVRPGIEGVYHRMVRLIESNAVAGPTADMCEAFIDRLNPEIKHLNEQYHRARKDLSANVQPEPIPTQDYIGEPITPTPKVYFITPEKATILLELGKDYNLTYKNNVKVGNAQCTIHGKGRYKGKKTVTFIIERR